MSKNSPTTDDRNFYEPLTERELEILRLMVEHFKDREISQTLHLALNTVKWYNSQIYSKLGVAGRDEAIKKSQRLGLLHHAEPVIPRHNLPAQITSFIGRKEELLELSNLVNSQDIRLLTILAPGGMGKTRLALEFAQQQLWNYPDGAFFVPLAPLSSHTHVITAIVDALKLRLQGDQDLSEKLGQYLSDKQMLLLLDNFEHLLDAAPLISTLLETAPQVKVLVSSREKLGLSGEKVFAIGGMTFPDWEVPGDAYDYDAIKLFVQCAELASSGIVLDDSDLTYVARICRLTEGMPLAIKLAAAWVDVLSLEDIAREIQTSVDFLAVDMRDMPSRQRSIRAVFEPTWKRLSVEEQSVFMKFAVFRGGCTREAAQVVTGATLRHLHIFINKALLTRTAEGRYEIHELLRQYAEERLNASGNGDAIQHIHNQYFADFLYELEGGLKGHQQTETLHKIEADFENIRNAWNHAIARQHLLLLKRMLESLCWYCLLDSHFAEGEALFRDACSSFEDTEPLWGQLQLRLIYVYRWKYGSLKHRDMIDLELEKCLKLARDTNNEREIAMCILILGHVAEQRESFATAIDYLQESLVRFQSIDDPFNSAWALHFLAMCSSQSGNIEKAYLYGNRSLSIRREIGDIFGVGVSLHNLAWYYLRAGDFSEAELYSRQVLSVSDNIHVAKFHTTLLGQMAFLQGDMKAASELAKHVLEDYSQNIYPAYKLFALAILGLVACVDEDYTQARWFCDQARMIAANPHISFHSDWLLSLVACGEKNLRTAIQANHDSLSHSYRKRTQGEITLCLPASAYIAAQTAHQTRAVQVLSLSFNYPKSVTGWLERWPLIDRLRQDLEESLGTHAYHLAWEQGKHMDLMTLVEELLAEYGIQNSGNIQ